MLTLAHCSLKYLGVGYRICLVIAGIAVAVGLAGCSSSRDVRVVIPSSVNPATKEHDHP